MNSEKLYESMNAINDKVLETSELAPVKNKKRIWMKWTAIAACLCVTVLGTIGLLNRSNEPSWPIKEVPYNPESSGDIAQVPKWEEMLVSQKFSELIWIQGTYSSRASSVEERKIAEKLEDVVLCGTDYNTKKEYSAEAEVYTIAGVSSECAVAVKFVDQEGYWVYVNPYYQPETLGHLIDALDLQENMAVGSVWYSYEKKSGSIAKVEFTGLDVSTVFDILLQDTTVPFVSDYNFTVLVGEMSISINIPLLGYENISLSVTQDGYLTTNMLDTGKAFYIGENAVNEFMDYVFEHCEGYEIVSRQAGEAAPEQDDLTNSQEITTVVD